MNSADIMGQTPLMRAVLCHEKETVNQGVVLGAELNAQSLQGNSALMLAAVQSPELVKLLLDSRADHKLRNNMSMTALMIASQSDCLACVKLLIQHGANPRRKNS
jgi:ankyrin repeat protein